MNNKVILISVDGMRPDGLRTCGNPYVTELERRATYTYTGQAVFPSVTFPCHYSMAHSVTPERHGILTNTYVPEVRPVTGIFEKIRSAGGVSAMFYGGEPLRDIASPGALRFSTYINAYMKESTDTVLTDEALRVIADKLEELMKIQVDAISNIKIDKVTVWDNGSSKDGKTATADFLSGMMKSVPPLDEVFSLAGMSLPTMLGKRNAAAPAAEENPAE